MKIAVECIDVTSVLGMALSVKDGHALATFQAAVVTLDASTA